jgi:hypothetical protein
MSLSDTIRQYWAIKHPTQRLVWHQRGGARMRIGEHEIEYRITRTKDTVFTLYAGGDQGLKACFVLELDFARKAATLQSVHRYNNCYTDNYENSRDLVRAAYQYAANQGMTTLGLMDLSTIECGAKKLPLAYLSFITTGQTWYESCLPPMECMDCTDFEEQRQRVRTATWRDVGADLIDIEADVDVDAPGSAMVVLNSLKKAKEFCWFFHKYMTLLAMRMGITSILHGMAWRVHIPQNLPSNSLRVAGLHTNRRYTRRRTDSAMRMTRSRRTNSMMRPTK